MDEILKKMNYKAGTAVVLRSPPEFEPSLAVWRRECPVALELGPAAGAPHPGSARAPAAAPQEPPAFLLVFARDAADFAAEVAPILPEVGPKTVFWVAFPKQTSPRYRSDLNRDIVWKLMEPLGFGPARNVAIDADWSALRFVRR